jgi:hypothetical protein
MGAEFSFPTVTYGIVLPFLERDLATGFTWGAQAKHAYVLDKGHHSERVSEQDSVLRRPVDVPLPWNH